MKTIIVLYCMLIAAVFHLHLTDGRQQNLVFQFSQQSSDANVADTPHLESDLNWDHFMFSQQWPMSVCIENHHTHKHKCRISSNISTWTVHGIWPSQGRSEGPSFCNKSAKFDPKAIEGIRSQLEIYWPNLFPDTPAFEFWEHEWSKHGTCAMTLESVNSELKYFSKGLELARSFDFLRLLQRENIEPTDTDTYEYDEVLAAFTKELGHEPQLRCIYDASTRTQYIVEVQICTDKSFNVITCPGRGDSSSNFKQRRSVVSMMQTTAVVSEGPCRATEQIAYPVIQPTYGK